MIHEDFDVRLKRSLIHAGLSSKVAIENYIRHLQHVLSRWAPIKPLAMGQRVRIEEEDNPPIHVGKLAIVEHLDNDHRGRPTCVLRVDKQHTPVVLPQRFVKLIEPRPSSLLANDLFLPWDLDDPGHRLSSFTRDNAILGRVMEASLFYDQIVVPTVDFAIIVPLFHWLGPRLMTAMLVSETLSFVRYAGNLGYMGDGSGLTMFEIHPGEKPDRWWTRVSRCTPSEAVVLQIRNRLDGIPFGEADLETFARLVELSTAETSLPEFTEKVANETYRDMVGSSDMRQRFDLRSANPRALPGLAANQIRSFGVLHKPAVAGDEIDIALRVAILNLEIYLASEAGTKDMVTDGGFSVLLDAKVRRVTRGQVAGRAFSRMLDVASIPDIASSISVGETNAAKTWSFRNSRVAEQFRQWFDRQDIAEPEELSRAYVENLRSKGFLSTAKAKAIRVLVIQAATLSLVPVINGTAPIVGAGLSLMNSLLLDNIRLGFRPKYFIDDLHHNLFPESQQRL